ncbi:Receptor-like protein kinase [Vitis vinifera]|uniref:non-specific serine/threonine protein kinase n=1 Tax=Vitis vinifera TaxID=29760 RepID=A0A438BUD1_VITVI|nr:Receptor-like protein kinase [Vitis vinifera]
MLISTRYLPFYSPPNMGVVTVVLSFLLLWNCMCLFPVCGLSSDGKALMALKSKWAVPTFMEESWNASHSTPCSWVGVSCDETHVVVSLNVSGLGISGHLGPEIAYLRHLTSVDFSYNSFSGPIPPEFGNCSLLVDLDLSVNGFVGEIPQNLNSLGKLEYLSFFNNSLTGAVPESLFGIPNLEMLYLNSNKLSGSIPLNVGNATQIIALWLYDNALSGDIPSSIGNCSELEELYLNHNQFLGVLPESINNLENLIYLDASNNNLEGKIPLGSGYCKKLDTLVLSMNGFGGEIPPGLGNCTSLSQFAALNNRLSGSIPSSFGLLHKLLLLYLSENHLSGKIPPEIGQCNLSGELPVEITELKHLKNISLFNNRFSGVIPQRLGINSSLVHENGINGTIPLSLGNCTNLTSINLSMNRLSGLIPQELGNLNVLQALNLSHNDLGGPLPSQLSNCKNLFKFDVGFNSLNGSFPSSLRSLENLSVLILRENRFTGGIPSFLSELQYLSEIQLGGNFLGGTIPSSIGMLQNLIYSLNISHNRLTGSLPLELGKLIMLEWLDISHNNLSGTLSALDGLHSLVVVDVSYNLFNGPLPETLLLFLNSSPSSLQGNPDLCVKCPQTGGLTCIQNRNFRPCEHYSSNRRALGKIEIAWIAFASLLSFLVLVGVVCMFLWYKRTKQEDKITAQEGSSSLLNKVIEATENLKECYIVGKGAHGTVYKASLGPHNQYALKKLVFAGLKGGSMAMVTEIQTVGKIRHRNLVKLEDFWIRKEYGFILYRYMENGSLHDVLHERNPPPILKWDVRYKIAIGTAHGLTYLHYDCDPAIVHRDVKPENILLDSDMEPHISDFGIAKLLDQSSSLSPSVSVVGTIGYIAPENAFTTTKSKESDVYSFGVVLLELITRKRALDPSFMEETDIVGWVQSIWRNLEEVDKIVDPSLLEEFIDPNIMDQVVCVLLVALRCTQKEASKRPTMRDVVNQLTDANAPARGKNS